MKSDINDDIDEIFNESYGDNEIDYIVDLTILFLNKEDSWSPLNSSKAIDCLGNLSEEYRRNKKEKIYEFIDSLEKKIEHDAGKFDPDSISTSFNGMAKLGYTGNIWEKLQKILLSKEYNVNNKFTPKGLVSLANAYAKVERRNEEIFDFIADQIKEEKYNTDLRFKPQQLANIVHGFGLANKEIPKLILDKVLENTHDFKNIELYQICMGFSLLDKKVPRGILERYKCYEDEHNEKDDSEKLNYSERQVFGFIKKYNLEVKGSYLFNGFEMDIIMPDLMLNIEIDGPYHLQHEDKRRDDYLNKEGWAVIRIKSEDACNGSYKTYIQTEINDRMKQKCP